LFLKIENLVGNFKKGDIIMSRNRYGRRNRSSLGPAFAGAAAIVAAVGILITGVVSLTGGLQAGSDPTGTVTNVSQVSGAACKDVWNIELSNGFKAVVAKPALAQQLEQDEANGTAVKFTFGEKTRNQTEPAQCTGSLTTTTTGGVTSVTSTRNAKPILVTGVSNSGLPFDFS
jgi:hypothetical protein